MKFICEKCGKSFANVQDCEAHETEHLKLEEEARIKKQAEEESFKEVEEAYQNYAKLYDEHLKNYKKPYLGYGEYSKALDELFKGWL